MISYYKILDVDCYCYVYWCLMNLQDLIKAKNGKFTELNLDTKTKTWVFSFK